jgi:hypothetical protein
MFSERGGDFNCNIKEHHSISWKNRQHTGHTNERHYLGVVVYSAVQKRDFFPDFTVIAEKSLLEACRRETVSKVFNQNTKKKKM